MLIDKLSATKYNWGAHCESYVLADTPGLSVKQEIMPPGTKELLHIHNEAQQFFFVLKGHATFYVNDAVMIIGENQGLHVLPKESHYIENTSTSELEFLVISQPATTNDRTNIE